MLLDVKLEAVRKHTLIRFESSNRRIGFAPNLNIAAQNCPLRRALERPESLVKPVWMRAAIGIGECKNVGAGLFSAAIARWARSRF